MPSSGGSPTQLELPFVARSLRACVSAYLASHAGTLSPFTVRDYQDRAAWVLSELGENTPIDLVNYDALDRVVQRNRGVLKDVTIKKRLVFLRAALTLEQHRGRLDKVPALPKLRNDAAPGGEVHTVEQWQIVRQHILRDWVRDFYDLAFWTGLRLQALMRLKRCELDPGRPVVDEQGQEVERGMYLRDEQPGQAGGAGLPALWIPMQPELKLLAPEILSRSPGPPDAPIIGQSWNLRRHLEAAVERAVLATGQHIPQTSPNRLRSSYASMLIGRGYTTQWVRLAMGHKGEYKQPVMGQPLRVQRPTVGDRHYYRPTPALMSQRPPMPKAPPGRPKGKRGAPKKVPKTQGKTRR